MAADGDDAPEAAGPASSSPAVWSSRQALDPVLAHQSIYKVTRELKKEQNSLFNCINSVVHDASFVDEIRALYPTLPLFANLRCGLWYTSMRHDDTCYFKSTDGHNGYWSFSTMRLNWNVCEAAARHGGAIIVDATRKGKTFPDALTKTVAIWAAVVNRAVARIAAASAAAKPPAPIPITSPGRAFSARQQAATAEGEGDGGCRVQSLSAWLQGQNLLQAAAAAASPEAEGGRAATAAMHSAVNGHGNGNGPCSASGNAHAGSSSSSSSRLGRPAAAVSGPGHGTALGAGSLPGVQCGGFVTPEAAAAAAAAAAADDPGPSSTDFDFGSGLLSPAAPSEATAAVPVFDLCLGAAQAPHCTGRVGSEHLQPAAASSECSSSGDGGGGSSSEWDCSLHLPLWISTNERIQIEQRLEGFVDLLINVGADVEGLAKILTKPLRPLWVSQSSLIWVDQVAQPHSLPFTPLVLVSASQPQPYQRVACSLASLALRSPAAAADAAGAVASASGARDGCDGSDGSDDDDGDQRGQRQHRRQQQQQQQRDWTYVYVPGAGDDEESWAAGLTPELFWPHHQELLQAGPGGVLQTVKRLRAQQQQHAAAPTPMQPAGGNGNGQGPGDGGVANGGAADADGQPGRRQQVLQQQLARDYLAPSGQQHLLQPSGWQRAQPREVSCRGSGLYQLGGTGLALGALAAGAAPDVWQHADAVLSLGPHPHPSMLGEAAWAWAPLAEAEGRGGHVLQGSGPGSGSVGVGDGQDATATAAGQGACSPQRPPSSGAGEGAAGGGDGGAAASTSGRAAAAAPSPPQGQQQGAGGVAPPLMPRYMWLPVQHCKFHRTHLLERLGPMLRFVSHHVGRGGRVLIHDANGMDTCVCVAVAALLACYGPCSPDQPAFVQAFDGGGGAWEPPEHVTREAVRQRLAFLSACYPLGRPTRGMLRQVFNFFVASGGADSGDGRVARGWPAAGHDT